MAKKRASTIACAAVASALVAVAAGAALVPVRFDSREELFEIPQGTWARRMSGDKVEILPERIALVTGIRNVLVLRNSDDVPQIFGPTLIMPGQTFRLPFERAAEYQFSCSAHLSGQMTVIVYQQPLTAWERLRYRALRLGARGAALLHRGVA